MRHWPNKQRTKSPSSYTRLIPFHTLSSEMASSSSPHSASESSDSPYLPLSPSHYPTSEFLRRSAIFNQPNPVGGQLFTAMTSSIFTVAGPLPVPFPSTAAAFANFQYSEMMAPISSTGTAATLPSLVSTGLEALEGLSELRGIMAVISKIGEVKKGLRENIWKNWDSFYPSFQVLWKDAVKR